MRVLLPCPAETKRESGADSILKDAPRRLRTALAADGFELDLDRDEE
jgi:hypothetical protein